jgi:hypothetical protein
MMLMSIWQLLPPSEIRQSSNAEEGYSRLVVVDLGRG